MAQDLSNFVPWAGPVGALATAGLILYIVFYFLTRHIPDIESRHRMEREQLHDDLMSLMGEHRDAMSDIKDSLKSIDSNIKGLRNDITGK